MTSGVGATQTAIVSRSDAGEIGASIFAQVRNLGDVFWNPLRAFHNAVRPPRSWCAVLVLTGASLTVPATVSKHVGWSRVAIAQARANPEWESWTGPQRAAAVDDIERWSARTAWLYSTAGTLVQITLVAFFIFLIFPSLADAKFNFHEIFSVTSWALIPQAIAALITSLVIGVRDPDVFDTPDVLMLDAGKYLDPKAPGWLQAAAGSVDFFSIWTVLLLTAGLSVGRRRIPLSRSFSVVLLLWVMWVAFKVVLRLATG